MRCTIVAAALAVLLRCTIMVAALSVLLSACTDRAPRAEVLPTAEFLVAAGDSTYWVRSAPEGLRVRSAPLLLTRSDGAFHELRIVEEAIDYFDAEFVREQLFGYALGQRDSVLLYADDAVGTSMAAWLAAHPGEAPLDPADEEAPEPESSASDFLEVIDVHGRWVSWAHALDIDFVGDTGHTHRRRRGVVDIRTGARALLDSLMSPADAARVSTVGRAAFDAMLAGVRDANDERAVRARETLHTFAFDVTSFSITDIARRPAIAFHVAGIGVEGEALELLLPPIPLEATPPWWDDVRPTLPEWTPDSLGVRWQHGAYAVIGTVDPSRTRLSLALVEDRAGARAWPVAEVPMPAYQFMALDGDELDDRRRGALLEAFDRASSDDPFAVRADHRRAASGRRTRAVFQQTRFR